MRSPYLNFLLFKLLPLYICLLTCAFAQVPQKFTFQSVIRNSAGQLLQSQLISMRISILQGSETGTAVFVETHTATTNATGLVSLHVGGGTPVSGSISGIDWANGPYFIKTETDTAGGINYHISGASQLLSVPFALYSANGTPGPQGPAGPAGTFPNGSNPGDMYIWNGTAWTFLAVGNQGQYLTVNNGMPAWTTLPGFSGPANIETSLIPSGSFTMGSPVTEPQRNTDEAVHEVTLSSFRMSKYEISNAQFAAFLNSKGIGSNGIYASGSYPTQALIFEEPSWGLTWNGTLWQPVTGKDNFPVVNVTWYGAKEFAAYAYGRLPTEAEWEYACRGGTSTPFYTGACLSNTEANYFWLYPLEGCTNTNTIYPGQTQSVNSYSPNAFGLYNMHGNVKEWCSDWYYFAYPTSPQTNPTGPVSGSARVVRGGSWTSEARYSRSAMRDYFLQSNYRSWVGFRLVFAP